PFRGSVDQATADIRTLFEQLDEHPLRGEDGRMFTGDAAAMAMITGLYSQGSWQYLSLAFSGMMSGDASLGFMFFDLYYSRGADGRFEDNSLEAQIAVH